MFICQFISRVLDKIWEWKHRNDPINQQVRRLIDGTPNWNYKLYK